MGRDDTNERNETVGRGKLLWDIGNDWEAKLSVLYADLTPGKFADAARAATRP